MPISTADQTNLQLSHKKHFSNVLHQEQITYGQHIDIRGIHIYWRGRVSDLYRAIDPSTFV